MNYLLRSIPTSWICRVGDCCVTNQMRNPTKTCLDFLGLHVPNEFGTCYAWIYIEVEGGDVLGFLLK